MMKRTIISITVLVVASIFVSTGVFANNNPTIAKEIADHAERTNYDKSGQLRTKSVQEQLNIVPGEFIIKFKSLGNKALNRCAFCLTESGAKFQSATADNSPSLDKLNKKFGIKSMSPIFRTEKEAATLMKLQKASGALLMSTVREAASQQNLGCNDQTSAKPDLTHIYKVKVDENTDIDAIVKAYSNDPHVEYAQPNYKMEPIFTPDDPLYHSYGSWGQDFADMWGLKADKMQMEAAWDITMGDESIVVGVNDSGVDYNHVDLADNIWINEDEIPGNGIDDDDNGYVDDVRGYDFADNDNDPMDVHGHGTHVAGTIAAIGDNAEGVIGVAPKVRIMPLKGFSDDENGSDGLDAALVYGAKNGAHVINNSWGCIFSCPSNPSAEEAVTFAHACGTTVVFAAGNSSQDVEVRSPQNMMDPKPIVVAASDENDEPTYFTNHGFKVDISAPGGGSLLGDAQRPERAILSTISSKAHEGMTGVNNELIVDEIYSRQAGTSMASPHAAGLAALMKSHNPELTNDEIRLIMRASADDVHHPGVDRHTGMGRINAYTALQTDIDSYLMPKIDSPENESHHSQLDGFVNISGHIDGYDIKNVEVKYRSIDGEMEWTSIKQFNNTNAVSVDWDISGLPTDTYLVSLEAKDKNNNKFADTIMVNIRDIPAIQITDRPDNQYYPRIYDDKITWIEYDKSEKKDALYMCEYDDKSGVCVPERISSKEADVLNYDISKKYIAWVDLRGDKNDVYIYDFESKSERYLTTFNHSYSLKMSDEYIVYSDYGRSSLDIYAFDIENEERIKITDDSYDQEYPKIYGKRIVYETNRDGNIDVFMYRLISDRHGVETQITDLPGDQILPSVSDDYVVWSDAYNNEYEMYYYNIHTQQTKKVSNYSSHKRWSRIFGNYISWQDWRSGAPEYYVYDILNDQETKVTFAHMDDVVWFITYDMSHNKLAWTDERDGFLDRNIYLVELEGTPPEIGVVGESSVKESENLELLVSATGISDNLEYSAEGLPEGAYLDILGDANLDGRFNITDVVRVVYYLSGRVEITERELAVSDVNRDGVLDVLDRDIMLDTIFEDNLTYILHWKPNYRQGGVSYPVTIKVNDEFGNEAEKTIILEVDDVADMSQNLLLNNSFENHRKYWKDWRPRHMSIVSDSHDGDSAVEYDLVNKEFKLFQPVKKLKSNTTYLIRLAVKDTSEDNELSLKLDWIQNNGRQSQEIELRNNSDEYRAYEFEVQSPERLRRLKLILHSTGGTGKVYFDSVSLHEITHK